MNSLRRCAACFAVFAGVCAGSELGVPAQGATAEAAIGRSAQAQLLPIEAGEVEGVMTFREVGDFVRVSGVIRNLAPGKHGFRVHEGIHCQDRGGHFAPGERMHGSPDAQQRHIGDLGNVTADPDGEVAYLRIDRLVQLAGPESIVGHVLVVHEDEYDYLSQPSGQSGEELACGRIDLITR